jgi:hypothetical protein
VRAVDWKHPANNDFLLVSQFSVTGGLSANSAFILLTSSLPLVCFIDANPDFSPVGGDLSVVDGVKGGYLFRSVPPARLSSARH